MVIRKKIITFASELKRGAPVWAEIIPLELDAVHTAGRT